MLSAELEQPYPQITFSVTCSSGTYIRTLCVDLGKALGVPAAMAKLTRTSSAGFKEQDCLTLEEIEQLQEQGTIEGRLLPADRALAHMPAFTVDPVSADRLLKGQKVRLERLQPEPSELAVCRLYEGSGQFLGIFQVVPEEGIVKPVKVFS